MHVPGLDLKSLQSEFANGVRESRRSTAHKGLVDPQKLSLSSKEPEGASYAVRPIRIHHNSLSFPQASPPFLYNVMNTCSQIHKPT